MPSSNQLAAALMAVFAVIGVAFLVASALAMDPLFVLLAFGAFSWAGILALTFQPWHGC